MKEVEQGLTHTYTLEELMNMFKEKKTLRIIKKLKTKK
jgi:hypothetical protein